MTPENFAFWLQGFVELTQGQTPNQAQWKSIQEHLGEVFKKVTPPVGGKVDVKIDVDTKDAQEAVGDLAKRMEELVRKVREAHPQPNWWQTPKWTPGLPVTITC